MEAGIAAVERVRAQADAQAARVPWRMCETQSFSGGGKAGVSDTFASALWALDYLFVLAGYGCAGVNMETLIDLMTNGDVISFLLLVAIVMGD